MQEVFKILIMKKIILFFSVLMLPIITWCQGLTTQGTQIVNSNGDEVLLRGIGPGGWQIMEGYMMQTAGFAGSQHEIKNKLVALMGEENTETFFEKWRENHFTQRDVDSLAAWGFNSIRIPMHYNLFTLPIEEEPIPGENTWIETGFELIDNVLEWAEPHDMYIILDMHATPGGQGTGSDINDYDPSKPSLWESQANKDKLVALWTRIADRYKDNEWIGGYDLINETHWDLPGNTALRALFEDITAGIRTVDTNHIIFIEGNSYANDHSGLTPPWDDNLVYSFHKYWNSNNEDDLDWILPLREEQNVPLWMGESGENSNTWFTEAVSLFENNNIGWAWWTIRKIGDIDSPYAVNINPGYQNILDYWQGNGPQPSSEEAFDAMMQLADNLLVDNSRYRRDVPDALIRQVQTDETIPFNYKPAPIPGVIHMSDFDLGKHNFAYHDNDVADYNLTTGVYQAWNQGWSYRNDGVDIETNDDDVNSNGFHVGFVNEGEWMKYTVEIEETANYKASLRLATQENGGTFYMSIDDQEVISDQEVSSTGGWTQFETFEVSDIILPQGEHSLKFYFSNDIAFNISSIEFEKAGTTDGLELSALTAKTGDNEKSVEVTITETVLPESLDDALGNFTVMINGEERTISSVTADSSRDRLIILTLEDVILSDDVVTVSYDGSLIESESNKTLNVFTDLVVDNLSPDRVILPDLIQVEDYDVMVGMTLEDTQDEGGGQNLGYTDAGDYADYLIYVPESGLYGIKFRVAGLDEGKIGLYSVDENDLEDELVVVSTLVTGDWQTWKTFSSNVFIEEGIQKLRMKIVAGGFNFNWFEFTEPDSDGDGVIDSKDACPNTSENAIVDINGCEIFNLPADNYALTIFSETCRSSNNGSISVAATANYDYKVHITGEDFEVSDTFSSEINFDNMSAGTYLLCITIADQPDYEQCFSIEVSEPDKLSVNLGQNVNASNVTVKLDGADTYYVTLNGNTRITQDSEIELDLIKGKNELSVKTNKACQGIYNKTILQEFVPTVYPNPVINDRVFVNMGFSKLNQVPIEIYDVSGKLIISKTYPLHNEELEIDLSQVEGGFLILKIITAEKKYNFKIIR